MVAACSVPVGQGYRARARADDHVRVRDDIASAVEDDPRPEAVTALDLHDSR